MPPAGFYNLVIRLTEQSEPRMTQRALGNSEMYRAFSADQGDEGSSSSFLFVDREYSAKILKVFVNQDIARFGSKCAHSKGVLLLYFEHAFVGTHLAR
jgi:hypothetical protein